MSIHDDQEVTFPETLREIVDLILYRLGDEDARVWNRGLVETFFIRGSNLLSKASRAVWDIAHLEDVAGQGLHQLPSSLLEVERCTWDYKRMSPTSATSLQRFDYSYRQTRGDVYAYIQDTDGLHSFRKIRIPSADYVPYTVTGEGPTREGSPRRLAWGIARDLTELEGGSSFTVEGAWGVPRRIPNFHPSSTSSFGVPRRFAKEYRNVRVEHFRRPLDPALYGGGVVELPPPYNKYVLWYALWQALEMDGPGQDVVMAEHYKARWADGLERAKRRQSYVDKMAFHRLGGGLEPVPRPPRPQLPWQYGEPVD